MKTMKVVLLLMAVMASQAAEPAQFGYFELRVYTVTSNKMDGVLERFRETVEPVRRKHGIKTVGYWSAPGTTNGGTFGYLMAAASKEELRKQEKEFGADPNFAVAPTPSGNATILSTVLPCFWFEAA